MKTIATFKKTFLKILLPLCALMSLQPAHANYNKALGLGFASASIGLAVMNEELAESETFKKISKIVNVNENDLAPYLVLGSALLAASFIPEGNGRLVLRLGALLPILAAACLPKKAINKLAQLPGIKQYFALMKEAKGLPLIGDYAQCDRLECAGLCHKCKARKLFLTVPFAAIPFIPTVYRSFAATIARWERERIALANRPHYEVLEIPLGMGLTEAVVNAAFRQAMLATHSDKTGETIGVAERIERITTARDALRNFLRRNNPQPQPEAPKPAQPEAPQPPAPQQPAQPDLKPTASDNVD